MPISLGDAILYFRGDTSGLDASTKEALKSVDDMSKKMAEAARGVGIAFAAMGASITAGVGFALKAFGESDAAARQLDAVLKSTSGAAGMTAEAIKGLAAELSKLTGIDDDVIVTGQNMLLTFTNIGKEVFPDATKALIDMATAMNGGTTPSAEQLKDTAIQLGKALNNPVEGMAALQRVGVRLSEDQKEQVKSFMAVNDVASAQRVILAELTKEFGGSAASAAASFGGKINELKTNFGNLLEVLGGSVAPLIGKMAAALGDAAQKAQAFAETHPEFTKWGVAITVALGATMLALSPVLIAMPNLVGGIKMLIGAFPSIVSGITSVLSYGPAIAAFMAGPGGVLVLLGLGATAAYKLADAWGKASEAEKENQKVQEHLPVALKQVEDALTKAGVKFDEAKVKSMATGEAIQYLTGLYQKHNMEARKAGDAVVLFSKEIADAADKINKEFMDKAEDRNKAESAYLEDAAQKETDYLADVAQAQADYLADAAQEQADHSADTAMQAQNDLEKFKDRLEDLARDYSDKIGDIQRDTADGLREMEDEFRQSTAAFYMSEAKAQEDYLDGVADRKKDHSLAITRLDEEEKDKIDEINKKIDEATSEEEKEKLRKSIENLQNETTKKMIDIDEEYKLKEERYAREYQQARTWAAKKAELERQEWEDKRQKFIEHQEELRQEAERKYIQERGDRIRENERSLTEKAQQEAIYKRELIEKENQHNRDLAERAAEHLRDRSEKEADHVRDLAEKDRQRERDFQNSLDLLIEKQGLNYQQALALYDKYNLDKQPLIDRQAKKEEEDQKKLSEAIWGDNGVRQTLLGKYVQWLSDTNATSIQSVEQKSANDVESIWSRAYERIKGWLQSLWNNVPPEAADGFNQGGFSGGYAFADGGTVQGSGGQVPIIANEEGPELARTPDGKEGIIGNGLPGLFMMPVGSVISTASETAAKLFRSFADGGVVGTGMDANTISQLGRMREAFVRLLGRAGADGRLDILDAQAAQADVQSGWERIVSWATDAAGLSSVTGTKENGSHTMALDRNGSYGIYHRFGGDGSTDYYLDGLEAYAKGGSVKDTRSKVDESKRSIVMQKFADALYRNYGSFPFDTGKFMDWAARIAAGWTSIDRQYGSDGKIAGYGGAQGTNTFGLVRGADGIGSVSWGQRGALERLKIPGVEAFAAGGRVNGAGGVTLNVNVGALHVREEADIQRVSREIARQMKSSLLGVYA